MSPLVAEFLGTAILILLGDGVVANVLLRHSKGQGGGWIVITAGWAFAVTVGVYLANAASGAHLNPAVTLGLAAIGKFDGSLVPGYVLAQMLGAMAGATGVWLAYLPHWAPTEDVDAKRAVFCTAPAIRQPAANFLCEVIGTAVLVGGVLAIAAPHNLAPNSGWDRGFAPFLVGLLVWAIGLSLGGPTGYAINPARDLGPRLAHAILPIAGKGSNDWGYAWVPIAGPLLGGVIGAWVWKLATGSP
ncbi:MAG: aquaporin family protein [Verrucomicrobiales bacterium]|nr:aquaporin family protein [Verrucomicrobiales bacterium]